jgi:hypothetical protein|tara:strand:+ start:378 stop:521 length:144 start_codon:yes stop_codon:yes gene_type:complete
MSSSRLKALQEMFKRVLLENTELKKKVRVLEEILRSYIPILSRRRKK